MGANPSHLTDVPVCLQVDPSLYVLLEKALGGRPRHRELQRAEVEVCVLGMHSSFAPQGWWGRGACFANVLFICSSGLVGVYMFCECTLHLLLRAGRGEVHVLRMHSLFAPEGWWGPANLVC